MGTSASILIASFGEARWADQAREVALPSALEQDAFEVIVEHSGRSIAEARNTAAAKASGDWLIFLDADDQLEAGYVEALLAHARAGRLLAPAVRFVEVDRDPPPAVVLDDRDIRTMNPCVVGTAIDRVDFARVGGFWRERAWEDWSLFRRAWLLGAEVVHVPEAVYRVNVNPAGRNSTVDRPRQLHREIIRSHAVWKRRITR